MSVKQEYYSVSVQCAWA